MKDAVTFLREALEACVTPPGTHSASRALLRRRLHEINRTVREALRDPRASSLHAVLAADSYSFILTSRIVPPDGLPYRESNEVASPENIDAVASIMAAAPGFDAGEGVQVYLATKLHWEFGRGTAVPE